MLDIRFGGGSKFYFDEQSDCWAPTATVIACRGINTYKAGHKFAILLNTVREVERNLLAMPVTCGQGSRRDEA